jgi:hypothetical protein
LDSFINHCKGQVDSMSRKKYTAARRLLFLHAEHITAPGTCGLPPPARDKRLTAKATSSVETLFSINGRKRFEAVFKPTAFNTGPRFGDSIRSALQSAMSRPQGQKW